MICVVWCRYSKNKAILRTLGHTYQVMNMVMMAMFFSLSGYSQEAETEMGMSMLSFQEKEQVGDTLKIDTLDEEDVQQEASIDSVVIDEEELELLVQRAADTTSVHFFLTEDSLKSRLSHTKRERFIPDPKKALWLAIIFPGGGQIYNRKYWKLPLIYGGFIGCLYALNWNNTMYRDYSQAYIDIMDSDENTKSYENFISKRYDINGNKTRLQEIFKRKKNYYRRYRDLSMFCMIGVYALSIIDAYVDAELSSFDISRDLTLKVHPAVINDKYSAMRNHKSCSYGLQCSLNF